MRNWIAVAVLGLMVGPQVRAQQKSPPDRLTPYRLYFTALADNLNGEEETPAVASHFNAAGIPIGEHKIAVQALALFKKRFGALLAAYNNSPATLANRNDDTTVFLIQRDLIVQGTIDTLKVALSKSAIDSFERRVASEVKNMKFDVAPAPEAGLHQHSHVMPVQGTMTPHYNFYRSDSVSVSGSDITNATETYYNTVTVEGYTSCGACGTARHQGIAHNGLATGTMYGPWQSATSYISVSNSGSYTFGSSCFDPAYAATCTVDWSEEGQVACSLVGLAFWKPSEFLFVIKPYNTYNLVDSYDGSVTFNVEQWCYNCCVPPTQGCPAPLVQVDKVYYHVGSNPPVIPTAFMSVGVDVSSNFLPPGWHPSPGFDFPHDDPPPVLKQYCTPWQAPPY